MTELTPSYIDGTCTSAQEDRLIADDLICSDGVAKVSAGSLLVVAGAAGITVDVAFGGCFILGDDPAANRQGTYHCYNDDTVNRSLAANASGNPRVDQIIGRVYDSNYSGSTDAWAIEVLTGTPTVGANLTNLSGAAALPDNSIRLAYVLVPNGATLPGQLTIQDARTSFKFCSDNAPAGMSLVGKQIFTADGAFTKASFPLGYIARIRCIGGGGAGGGSANVAAQAGSGGGGGSGAYSESWILLSAMAASETVDIGAGGTGVSAANGNNGAQTTFGATPLVRANGGNGGNVGTAGTTAGGFGSGTGGDLTSAVGDVTMPGRPGVLGIRWTGTSVSTGGGGSSVLGGGANGRNSQGAGNSALANTGGGGGGGGTENGGGATAGGNGGSGICIVEVFG